MLLMKFKPRRGDNSGTSTPGYQEDAVSTASGEGGGVDREAVAKATKAIAIPRAPAFLQSIWPDTPTIGTPTSHAGQATLPAVKALATSKPSTVVRSPAPVSYRLGATQGLSGGKSAALPDVGITPMPSFYSSASAVTLPSLAPSTHSSPADPTQPKRGRRRRRRGKKDPTLDRAKDLVRAIVDAGMT